MRNGMRRMLKTCSIHTGERLKWCLCGVCINPTIKHILCIMHDVARHTTMLVCLCFGWSTRSALSPPVRTINYISRLRCVRRIQLGRNMLHHVFTIYIVRTAKYACTYRAFTFAAVIGRVNTLIQSHTLSHAHTPFDRITPLRAASDHRRFI